MAIEKVKITVRDKHVVTLKGEGEAIRDVLAIFVRGATEKHIDEQHAVGRTRDEVLAEMCKRIRIAERHFELGESDGFKCDLRDA